MEQTSSQQLISNLEPDTLYLGTSVRYVNQIVLKHIFVDLEWYRVFFTEAALWCEVAI